MVAIGRSLVAEGHDPLPAPLNGGKAFIPIIHANVEKAALSVRSFYLGGEPAIKVLAGLCFRRPARMSKGNFDVLRKVFPGEVRFQRWQMAAGRSWRSDHDSQAARHNNDQSKCRQSP